MAPHFDPAGSAVKALRRVLFVAYAFPPVGGGGVQRVTKFLKYLPAQGWLPSVLTVDNPSVPVLDESLLKDVPPETLVRRAPTWEPSYGVKAAVTAAPELKVGPLVRTAQRIVREGGRLLLQPDAQILWLPGALREGRRLLRKVPHAAIVATGPPFSSFLVAAALARTYALPLVLDYRDEWGISRRYEENKRSGSLGHFVQDRLQRWVVRVARLLVTTTRSSARALDLVRERSGSSARVAHIYNGYDPDDFDSPAPPHAGHGPYRLVYTGTLWNLTTATPLVEAALELARRRPDLGAQLELVFAGRRTASEEAALDRLATGPCRVVRHGYLGHVHSIELARSACGLCLLLADVPEAPRVVPAKLFEYLATHRPILAIAPRGEVWELLGPHPLAFLHEPGDVSGIAGRLEAEIGRHLAGCGAPEAGDIERYSRRHEAAELARLLDSLPSNREAILTTPVPPTR